MMRFTTIQTLCAVAALTTAALFVASANAVPITGGTGPGGIETTAGGLSDLELWLKADAITGLSDNDPVGAWANSAVFSGAATSATQSDADQQPLFKTSIVNGQPIVRFDGINGPTGDRLSVSDVGLGAIASGFVLALHGPQSGGAGSCCRTLFSENTAGTNIGNNGYTMYTTNSDDANGSLSLSKGLGTSAPTIGVATFPIDNVFHVFSFRSNTSNSELFNNAGLLASGALAGAPTGTNYHIGGNFGQDSRSWRGDIAEVALFDRDLNDAEMQIINNYLSAKYGVTLGAGDVYIGDESAQGDYDRDVFGVGQVDSSNVHLNGGAAGFGIETTDPDLTDNEWVLAGHNVETNTLLTGPDNRWQRVWYVDATKVDAIDATLSFDFSDAGLTAPDFDPNQTGISLLYSATDPFNFMNLGLTAMISGDTVSFDVSNLQLLDGYYTLGVVAIPEPSSLLMFGMGGAIVVLRRRRRVRTRKPQVR